MTWLIAASVAYFLFAITSLIDKKLLSGPSLKPRAYAFYIAFLGIGLFLLIPFAHFTSFSLNQFLEAMAAGALTILSLYVLFYGLSLFKASQIIPAVGAISPVFTLSLIYLFSNGTETLTTIDLCSFLLLIIGGALVSYEKGVDYLSGIKVAVAAAFVSALAAVMAKRVYLNFSFLQALILTKLGGILVAFPLLFFKEGRKEVAAIFQKKEAGKKDAKTLFLFLANQGLGALGGLLQSWSVFSAPLVFVSIISAMSGIEHAFLFILVSIPAFGFYEEFNSKKNIITRIIAIVLIVVGLAILSMRSSISL